MGERPGCEAFASQADSQLWFDRNEGFGDRLDGNGDGIACSVGDDCCPWGPSEAIITSGNASNRAPTNASANRDLCRLSDQRGLEPYIYEVPIQEGVDYGSRQIDRDRGMVAVAPMYAMGFPVPEGMNPTSGPFEVAFVAVDYPDAVGSESQLDDIPEIAEEVSAWFAEMSGGRLQINYHFGDRVYRIPSDSASFGLQGRGHTAPRLIQELVEVMDPVFDFTDIDNLWVLNPVTIIDATSMGGSAGSIANDFHKPPMPRSKGYNGDTRGQGIQTDEVFLTAWSGSGAGHFRESMDFWAFWTHETLHDMGIADTYRLTDRIADGTPIYDSGEGLQPMSHFSMMSNQDGSTQSMITWNRWLLGWLSDDQVYCMPADQLIEAEVSLVPLTRAEDGFKSLMIPLDERRVIVVESRRATGYDSNMGELAIGITNSDGKRVRGYLKQVGTSGLIVYIFDTGEFQHNGPAVLQVPDGRPDRFGHISENFLEAKERNGWTISPDDPWVRWDPDNPENILLEAFYDPLLRLGDSVTVEGVTIELVEWGDYDRVRITR